MNPLLFKREGFPLIAPENQGVSEAYNPRLSRLNTRSAR